MSSVALTPDAQWREFLDSGKLMLQRAASGRFIFPPRVAEPGTGAPLGDWIEISGAGTVHSTVVVRARPPASNYNVALIDLAEGPRMMSRVEGIAPEAVEIGMAVRARIVDEDGKRLVIFDPVRSWNSAES